MLKYAAVGTALGVGVTFFAQGDVLKTVGASLALIALLYFLFGRKKPPVTYAPPRYDRGEPLGTGVPNSPRPTPRSLSAAAEEPQGRPPARADRRNLRY